MHPIIPDEYDYDCPDVQRGIRNLVLAICLQIFGLMPPCKLKPRAQTLYEPMDDDDYENAEVINMLRMGKSFDDSDISSLRKITYHGSMDDIH